MTLGLFVAPLPFPPICDAFHRFKGDFSLFRLLTSRHKLCNEFVDHPDNVSSS